MEAAQQPRGVELTDLNSVASLAVLSVPEGSRVLDLGCGDGAVARMLSARGCRVVGVARNEAAAQLARSHCERVITGDIEAPDTRAHLAGETFDAVLMLDLLGSLRDPRTVIAAVRRWLRPEGRLTVSFRNVTHGAVRLSLLAGRFRSSDDAAGQGPSRLFDGRAVESLLQAAGLHVVQRLRVTRSLEDTDVSIDAAAFAENVVEPLRRDPDALTYEHVFVASANGVAERARGGDLAEHLQRRVQEVEAICSDLESRASRVTADAAAQSEALREMETVAARASRRVTELETELARRMEELHIRHQEVRQLQADVALREGFIVKVREQAAADRITLSAVRGELQRARAEVAGDSGRLREMHGALAELRAEATRAHAEVARLQAALPGEAGTGTGAAAAGADQAAERIGDLGREPEAARAEHGTALEDLHREVDDREEAFANAIASLTAQVTARQQAIDVYESSRSWRITAPMRGARRVLGRLTWEVRGALSRTVRGAYRHAPLPEDSKRAIKRIVFTRTPVLVRHTVAYKEWQEAIRAAADPPERAKDIEVPAADQGAGADAAVDLAPDGVPDAPLTSHSVPSPEVLAPEDALFHGAVDTDYVALTRDPACRTRISLIAFYESRFYPTSRSDGWWLPGELGFYDLRVPTVIERQIELARLYGIRGFCFRYCWFSGERLFEAPLEQYLRRSELDFPFCISWSHAPVTREWDDRPDEVLIAARNDSDDAGRFFSSLEPALRDARYIRFEGRPVVVVERPEQLADPAATAATWRRMAQDAGLGELLLISATPGGAADPGTIGFDAVLDMPVPGADLAGVAGTDGQGGEFAGRSRTATGGTAFPVFPCVVRGWDEEARRPARGGVFTDVSPERYREWLENACGHAERQFNHRAPLVFVQSWNGWAEGSQLEPDQRHGYAYLQATADALRRFPERSGPPIVCVSHDAQFSGAQLLLLNLARAFSQSLNRDVELLLCGDGPLRAAFADVAHVGELYAATSRETREALVRDLIARGARSALCNTAVVGEAAELLHECGLTVVSLVHELPGLIRTFGREASAQAIARAADTIVFAADVVRDRFVELAGPLRGRSLIRPQGLYLTNAFKGRRAEARREVAVRAGVDERRQLVIGAGYGDHRKGFDLFVETGLCAARLSPSWLFIWLGDIDAVLLAGAKDRIAREGQDALFLLPGFVQEPDAFFAAADAFLLTSREDPFPSVVLEALDVEVPVIAFAEGGGFVELLRRGCGVLVPEFDPASMARALAEVLTDPAVRTRLTRTGRRIVDDEFSFLEYARYLARLLSAPGPRISAIVPNYNYARYLPVRLRSILAQTYAPAEIIFLDDGSTDESVAIAESILADSGIPYRIIVNDKTEGCYQQWLRGLREASGELVWIAEADDSCEPALLSTLLPAFAQTEIVLAYCQSTRIDELGRQLSGNYLEWMADISATKWRRPYVRSGVDEIRDSLIVKNTIPNVSAVLMRKPDLSAIERELVTFRNAGDWLAYVHILERGSIAFFPEFLNHHRRHAQGLTEQGGVNLMRESLLVQQRILERHIILPDVDLRRDEALQDTYQHLGLHHDGPPSYRDHTALKDLLPPRRAGAPGR